MKNVTETITQDRAAIKDFADNHRVADMRDCRAMKISQWSRQGDVMIYKIKEVPAAWNVLVKEHNQVALGQSTGSRHCADGKGIQVMWPESKDKAVAECPIPLFKSDQEFKRVALGPCVIAPEGFVLTHPEHAHHRFGPGMYLTTYQVDLNTKREVRD